MISVIIPLYNKEKFITETIKSVLNQTFTDFELLIVNDGSTDDSLKNAHQFNDDRLRLINIKNSGVSIARNTGIKAAKHNWIALLDADDWWAPTFLEEIVEAINLFPNHKLFSSGRSRVFKSQVERYQHEFLPEEGKTKVINYYKVISKYLPLINSSNVVIDNSLFKTKGYFREGQINHEDQDLWMRLCVNEEVVFINKNLSFYRKTEEITASTIYYNADDFCLFLETILKVNKQLTKTEKNYFKDYYNKFILLTYIKNYDNYSKEGENKVFQLILKIITGKQLLLVRLLRVLPFKKKYLFLKYFKR